MQCSLFEPVLVHFLCFVLLCPPCSAAVPASPPPPACQPALPSPPASWSLSNGCSQGIMSALFSLWTTVQLLPAALHPDALQHPAQDFIPSFVPSMGTPPSRPHCANPSPSGTSLLSPHFLASMPHPALNENASISLNTSVKRGFCNSAGLTSPARPCRGEGQPQHAGCERKVQHAVPCRQPPPAQLALRLPLPTLRRKLLPPPALRRVHGTQREQAARRDLCPGDERRTLILAHTHVCVLGGGGGSGLFQGVL